MNEEKRYIIFIETVNNAKKNCHGYSKKKEKTITIEDKCFGTR